MMDNKDKLSELTEKLMDSYGDGSYTQMKDIEGIKIGRFSNVTVGKDKVDYYSINTKDFTYQGTISVLNPETSLRHKGSKAGIELYTIKRGDVVFPQKRKFRKIGVMDKVSEKPYVGHHGLMRISCGENRVDLAFFLKDYLMFGPLSDYLAQQIDKGSKLIDLIGLLPIPNWAIKGINGYSVSACSLKKSIHDFSILLEDTEKLYAVNHTHLGISRENFNQKVLKFQNDVIQLRKKFNRMFEDMVQE